MVQLTTEQRTFIVKKYYETRSYVDVQNAFRQAFPNRNPPAKSTIQHNIRKYETDGTSLNVNKGRSGRRRTVRTAENIEMARQALNENQGRQISCRRNTLRINKSSFHLMMKNDIMWYPYKINVVHKLEAGDYERRIRFCRWFSHNAHNIRFLSNIVIGDEAIFCMNGSVSTQNVRCYAPKGNRPEFKFEKKNQNRAKLHVWAGLRGNGEMNSEMLRNFAFPCIARAYNRYGAVLDEIL